MIAIGHISRHIGLALLVAAVTAVAPRVAQADPAAPGGAPTLTVPGPGRPEATDRREANRARMLDARIERLHAGLQLAPAQEKLWPPVADAVHSLAEARGRRFREQLDAVADPVDKLQMQGDHMAKVGTAMGRLAAATKPLVASLTPEQKGKLPALMARAPLRKVLPRAFGMATGAEGNGAAGAAAAPPSSAPSAGTGASPAARDRGPAPRPDKDPDDDE